MREPFSDWTNWRAPRASPPSGSPPDGGAKPAKIDSLIEKIFCARPLKNVSIFAGFASLLTQGRAASRPPAALRAAMARGQGVSSP